jgi:glutamate:GABA antiporter
MRKLNNFILIAITISAIVNLRGLALMASGGLTTLSLSLLAALCFLIPSTYVAAQLGAHVLKRGGVYEWVCVAFTPRWGMHGYLA